MSGRIGNKYHQFLIATLLLRFLYKILHLVCQNEWHVGFRQLFVKIPGGTWILVLYTCANREMWKKKTIAFETECNSRESRLGVKTCLFTFSRKRVLLKILLGAFRNLFFFFFLILYFTKRFPQKSCLRGKKWVQTAQNSCFGGKIGFKKKKKKHAQNSSLEVFFLKRANPY